MYCFNIYKMDFVTLIKKCNGFEWDKGNQDKNWVKHKVKNRECEEVIANEALFVEDTKHSKKEFRVVAYGETMLGRKLTVIFTIRDKKIRMISARDQSKKEKNELLIKNK